MSREFGEMDSGIMAGIELLPYKARFKFLRRPKMTLGYSSGGRAFASGRSGMPPERKIEALQTLQRLEELRKLREAKLNPLEE